VSAVPVRVTEVAGSQFRRVDSGVEARILSANSWRSSLTRRTARAFHHRTNVIKIPRAKAVLPFRRAPTMVILLGCSPGESGRATCNGLEALIRPRVSPVPRGCRLHSTTSAGAVRPSVRPRRNGVDLAFGFVDQSTTSSWRRRRHRRFTSDRDKTSLLASRAPTRRSAGRRGRRRIHLERREQGQFDGDRSRSCSLACTVT